MADRDNAGRFVPGHNQPGPGRPKRETEQEILEAIKTAYPPEVIIAKLKRAMEIAEETNSARGMIACLEFAASYSLGKPTQRIQQLDTVTPEAWLAAILDDDNKDEPVAAALHRTGAAE